MKNNILKNQLIQDLKNSNKNYILENKDKFTQFVNGQNPKIAVLTCSDSRVIPEFIFNKSIGDIFVVRVAGNVTIDESVISSLEYAVEHLNVELLIILGHTNCGAIAAAEKSVDNSNKLLDEIRKSFKIHHNHFVGNIMYQLEILPNRSKIISDSIKNRKLHLIGAVYDLKDGTVEFLV